MKNVLNIFLLIFICHSALTQNTLKGTVSDAVSGQKLQDVAIYISDLKKVVSTDEKGEFNVSGLPDGYFLIQFSLLGFQSYDLNIETGKINEPLKINLVPTEISTEEIIVTETNVEKPYQTDKIKAKDLQRQGAMNISEAVTKIPGVWQLSSTSGVAKPVIRGLYGNRIGIMINGIRFDNQQWQDEHGLVMSSDGIDNIEVIKGPRSLLYGPEAIGGVVSITDEHPAPVGSNIADMNVKFFSNTLGILADVGLKGAERTFNWLIRFGGETHADYLDGNSDRIPETRFGGYTVKTAFGYNKGIWVSSLNYSYTSYTYGILEQRDFQNEINTSETRFDRSFNGPHHVLKVHNAVLQNTFLTGKSKFKLNAGFTYNRRKEVEGNDERFLPDSLQFGDLNMLLKTFSLDGSWNYTLKHGMDLVIGSQGFTQTNRNSGSRRLIPDANVNSLAATGILKYQRGRLGFEGGLRFDIFNIDTYEYGVKDSIGYFPKLDLTFRSFNGSAGITYRISKEVLLKTNLSTGFRAPNLAELTSKGLHEGTFQYEIGNPNFKREQSLEADLGFVIDSKFLSMDVSAYNNYIKDYIYLEQTKDTIHGYPVFRYYQSDAVLRGLEADLNIKPNKWLSFRETYSVVFAKRVDGAYLPLIPADRITSGIHAELNNWKFIYSPYFDFSANGTLRKTRPGDNETTLPGYVLFNAEFGCDFVFEKQKLNISLACNNLLNKVYIDFMSRIKIITATFNGETFHANNMGRNIVLSVRVPFMLSY